MLFSSISFVYYFLPPVLTAYFAVPERFKNCILLSASLIFYGCGEPIYLFLMLAVIVLGYASGLLIGYFKDRQAAGQKQAERPARVVLIACVLILILLLGYYKYFGFLADSLNAVTGIGIKAINTALPIGISFYMFQVLSYVTDIYRGDVTPQKNFVNFAAYVSMFPQLIAGPIVRYKAVEKELKERAADTQTIYAGVRRFIAGFAKKILLANSFAELCSIFRSSDEKSVIFYWIYAAAFMLFIYYDFSGYSDMAIGLGRILGFSFPENFNYPYISKSITEFWRRWHMTLGGWFRDYVYIPLGGNRVPKGRWIFNIAAVWALTGLWHGASWNFVLWGSMFAVILAIEKLFLNKALLNIPDAVKHIYVILLVLISFVIFNAEDVVQAGSDLTAMFGGADIPIATTEALYYMKSYAVTFVLGIVGATPAFSWISDKLRNSFKSENAVYNIFQITEPVVMIVLLIICTAFLVDGSFNPFLYFRF